MAGIPFEQITAMLGIHKRKLTDAIQRAIATRRRRYAAGITD